MILEFQEENLFLLRLFVEVLVDSLKLSVGKN